MTICLHCGVAVQLMPVRPAKPSDESAMSVRTTAARDRFPAWRGLLGGARVDLCWPARRLVRLPGCRLGLEGFDTPDQPVAEFA